MDESSSGRSPVDFPSFAFPRERRLRKRRDFLLVQQGGARVSVPHFLLLLRARGSGLSGRLGITVTRKYGCAVERNRVKRLVREAVRLHPDLVPAEIDFVVIPKPGQGSLGLAQVVDELCGASSRIRRQAARLLSELAQRSDRHQNAGSIEGSSS